ncbi:MAG: hypothetical protein R3F43_11830 [bacterium]
MRARLRNISACDWLVLGFTAYMAVRAFLAPESPDATVARRVQGAALVAGLLLLLATRWPCCRPAACAA